MTYLLSQLVNTSKTGSIFIWNPPLYMHKISVTTIYAHTITNEHILSLSLSQGQVGTLDHGQKHTLEKWSIIHSPSLSLSFERTHSFSFSLRWQRSAWKGPYALHPASQQSPQGCPWNSANVCQVEHRLFPTSQGGVLVTSFFNSSLLQVINAVMIKPVHIHKVPQASEDLCPTKLQTCSTYTHTHIHNVHAHLQTHLH